MAGFLWLGRALGAMSETTAKRIGVAVTLALIALALFGAKIAHDRALIANHDAGRDASASKADRAADTQASEDRREDDARLANETVELGKVGSHAQTEDDRRIARMRCVRMQQDARAAGRVAPACN